MFGKGGNGEDIKPYIPVLLLLFLGAFIDGLDATIVNVALPTMAGDLHISLSNSTWIVMGYVLSLAALLIPCGKFSKNGRVKKFFIQGTAVLTVGSLLCGVAPTFEFLVAFRIMQGVGAALMSAAMPSLIVRLMPSNMKGIGMAAMGGASGAALVLGPPLGGLIAGMLSWHWVFFINVPIGILLVFLAAKYIPADGGRDKAKDPTLLGAVSLFCFVVCLLVMLENTGDNDMERLALAGFAVGAVVSFIVLVFSIRRDIGRAIIAPQMVFNKEYMYLGIAFLLSTIALTGTNYVMPYFLQICYGMSPVDCGLFMTISSISMLLIVFKVGKHVDRHGGLFSSIAAQLCRMAFAAAIIIVSPPAGLLVLAVFMVFQGFSGAFSGTGHTTRMIYHATPGYEDEATNFLLVINYAAAAIGPVLYAIVISFASPPGYGESISQMTPAILDAAFSTASMVGIGLLVLALILSVIVPNKIPKKDAEASE